MVDTDYRCQDYIDYANAAIDAIKWQPLTPDTRDGSLIIICTTIGMIWPAYWDDKRMGSSIKVVA